MEGADKARDPKPFSAGMLAHAAGPFAPVFRGMVWDLDGRARLDLQETVEAWREHHLRAVNHFQWDDQQAEKAKALLDRREDELRRFFANHREEIVLYFDGLERRDRNRTDPARMQVASLRAQSEIWEDELRRDAQPWLLEIDQLWRDYEHDLNAAATAEQRQKQGWLALERPGRRALDSESIDKALPYFLIVAGGCLILGLFTRTASIAAALFLFSVIATQWPGSAGAAPVYNEAVEMLALLVLAATAAGRFAGLDFCLRALRMWCCPPKHAHQPPDSLETRDSRLAYAAPSKQGIKS